MNCCKNAEQDEKVDQLLMVTTNSCSKRSLRVVKFCYLLEYRPSFRISQRLKFLSQLHYV